MAIKFITVRYLIMKNGTNKCNNFAQSSRGSGEPRASLFLEEPKPEKQDTRTLKELWADVRWERKAPVCPDVYIPETEKQLQTRSGRTVRTNRQNDMLYYQ